MTDAFAISDLQVLPLTLEKDRLVALSEDDHLLRRFGQVELRRFLPENKENDFTLRAVADEVWVPLEGEVEIRLADRRPGSPSENLTQTISLAADHPQALLIPFGVAYSIIAQSPARLLRLTTHADGKHAEDQTLPRNELSALFSSR